MNHDPAPEVTATGWRGAIQRFARWRHFREWEYGECWTKDIRDNSIITRARRSRYTGAVQFVLWPKGTVVQNRCSLEFPAYVYPADWWHDFDSSWWPNFKADLISA